MYVVAVLQKHTIKLVKGSQTAEYTVGGSHHEHVRVRMCERTEVGHGVLNQRTEDEAEADTQVDVDSLNEAVGVRQRRPRPHHQSGHSQNRGHPWQKWFSNYSQPQKRQTQGPFKYIHEKELSFCLSVYQ